MVVLALAAGFLAWVLLDRYESADKPAASTASTADGPRITTADGLSALAALRGGPVYWAGPRPGVVFEVTENAGGHVFDRYLPSGTQLGDPRPDYLTVATYPRPDAQADVEAAAKRSGAVTIPLPGGLAVYDEAEKTAATSTSRAVSIDCILATAQDGEAGARGAASVAAWSRCRRSPLRPARSRAA